jgi:hypothetical protein
LKQILIVYNSEKISSVEMHTFCRAMDRWIHAADIKVFIMPTGDPSAPDIRIWDLADVRNGEPIPPAILEKLNYADVERKTAQ